MFDLLESSLAHSWQNYFCFLKFSMVVICWVGNIIANRKQLINNKHEILFDETQTWSAARIEQETSNISKIMNGKVKLSEIDFVACKNCVL